MGVRGDELPSFFLSLSLYFLYFCYIFVTGSNYLINENISDSTSGYDDRRSYIFYDKSFSTISSLLLLLLLYHYYYP